MVDLALEIAVRPKHTSRESGILWSIVKGLGDAELAQLLAALELGRRTALPAKREETVPKSTNALQT